MQSELVDIVRRLEARQFQNEQAIKQGVVLRLLASLGWDIYDPKSVWPEFSVEGGHVDFALCNPSEHPRIFIEVKQSSTFNIGEDQLMMKYAFQHGVPIAVLTDGQRWSFYLPSGNGSFEERRFYLLDLLERDADEIELRLRRYLAYVDVKTNRAFDAARADHDDAGRRRAIAGALPVAWREMIQEADARLIQALLTKVESSTGYQPQETEVATFLRGQVESNLPQNYKILKKPPTSPKPPTLVSKAPKVEPTKEDDTNWFTINGIEKLRSHKAIEVTVSALRDLSNLIPQFLEDLEREMLRTLEQRGRKVHKRRWIGRSRESLYANPKLYHAAVEISPGWWLGTNYSNGDKREMLSIARQVANHHGVQMDFHLV